MNPLRNTVSARKPKVVFTLDTPYSETKWPAISAEVQSAILDLLCSFLSPVGDYRRQHLSFSNEKPAKKGKKRKRSIKETFASTFIDSASPEVLEFMTVGFNTTTRHLEDLAQKCTGKKPLVAIFVPHAEQPKILHSHLPVLIKAASLGSPSLPPIRLVPLASGAEARLIKALGIPRVGLIGLMDNAPAASQLIQLTRTHVPVVEIP